MQEMAALENKMKSCGWKAGRPANGSRGQAGVKAKPRFARCSAALTPPLGPCWEIIRPTAGEWPSNLRQRNYHSVK